MTLIHDDLPLLTVGPPIRSARAVTILLHGRARTPEEMIGVTERLNLPAMTYLAPTAPGASWYPQSFLANVDDNQPQLDLSLARITALVGLAEESRIPKARIGLVGFSQGACLAAEYLFRHPARWGAIALLTGGVIGPPSMERAPSGDLAGAEVYLGTSEDDPWVPVERVRATADLFRSMNASVQLHETKGGDHAMTDVDIAATRAILLSMLRA